MGLKPGSIIQHYKIISGIGKGGMGEVYLAQDTRLDRRVALKILPRGLAKNSAGMSRFVREAKSASALNHPNIITIHEIGESKGTHFIATEFIDGKTLREYAKSDSLNLKSALEIAIQIASALDEAHSAGIVHRDIKPDNVMIRPNGLVKILDFGIAKLVNFRQTEEGQQIGENKTLIKPSDGNPSDGNPSAESPATLSTTPGMIIGTANYMSPEQAKGTAIDARSDIFSFGIVLYEMIAGHLPFEGETPMAMIGAIMKDAPKPLPLDVPAGIAQIIEKCLRKDVDKRYQSIKEVLKDLQEAKRDIELQDTQDRLIVTLSEENKTQILQPTAANKVEQQATNQTVAHNPTKKYLAMALAILLVSAIGFFGYKYLSSPRQIESIAVMPFVNESDNQDVEYISDGMTETLIKNLSNLPNLNVKPRSTVFRYKGKDTDLKTIGKELNVQAILNGRIVQRGDQMTLSLELVDVQKDSVIWTEQYSRKNSELVTLQSDIARDISRKLKAKITGEEETKVTKTGTTDPEAYQAYLKGRYYWNSRTAENFRKAIEQFKIATDRDPNYAQAYVGLADSYILLNEYAGTPTSETLPKAKAFAEKAIALDDQLAEPHTTLASLSEDQWQWAEAEKEYKRAIELNPNYATAYQWYSILLKILGRYDEAATAINHAKEIDPLSSIIGLNASIIYQLQNNHAASIENSLKIIELDPNFGTVYYYLGLSYLKQGRNAEAIAAAEKTVELTNRANSSVLGGLGYIYAVTGKTAEANAIIKEMEEKYTRGEATGAYIATVYAGLGEKDKAFEWLEKDFQNKDAGLPNIRWQMPFESLHDDPRYKDLLKRMNIPQ